MLCAKNMATGLLNDVVFEEFRRYILPSTNDTPCPEKRSGVTFPDDLINQENIQRISQFFRRVDSLDTTKLLTVFDNMDKKHRVDPHEPSTAEVATVVVTFVERILNRVGEIDPRFTSILLHGGSFYDGVKIGKPDEFDFTAKIEKLCSADGLESRFSVRKKGFVYVVVKDADLLKEFNEFFTEAEDFDEVLSGDEKILSVGLIEERFRELTDRALRMIHVPEVLTPSDKEKGITWHSVRHGPCATICATYHSVSLGEMSLDIDIAPTFDLPPPNFIPPVLNLVNLPCLSDGRNPLQSKLLEMLQNKLKVMVVPFAFDKITQNSDGKSWSYEYSETWRVSFNSLEKFVFSLYDHDSVEKQLYRVLKILKETFIQKTPDLVTRAGTSEMKLEEPPSTKVKVLSIEPVGFLPAFSVEEIDDGQEGSENDTESSTSLCESEKDCEVLYKRSPSLSSSDAEDDPSVATGNNPNRLIRLQCSGDVKPSSSLVPSTSLVHSNPIQEYRSSEPLIKTYHFKMILFSIKLLLVDQKMWTRENLPGLVLFVLKTLFFVYSSRQRRFNNFWFQEMIDSMTWRSVALEILHTLEDILDELEQRADAAD